MMVSSGDIKAVTRSPQSSTICMNGCVCFTVRGLLTVSGHAGRNSDSVGLGTLGSGAALLLSSPVFLNKSQVNFHSCKTGG